MASVYVNWTNSFSTTSCQQYKIVDILGIKFQFRLELYFEIRLINITKTDTKLALLIQ